MCDRESLCMYSRVFLYLCMYTNICVCVCECVCECKSVYMCVWVCVCVYVRVHGGPGQLGVDACPGVECGEGHRRGKAVLVAELGGRHAALVGQLRLRRPAS